MNGRRQGRRADRLVLRLGRRARAPSGAALAPTARSSGTASSPSATPTPTSPRSRPGTSRTTRTGRPIRFRPPSAALAAQMFLIVQSQLPRLHGDRRRLHRVRRFPRLLQRLRGGAAGRDPRRLGLPRPTATDPPSRRRTAPTARPRRALLPQQAAGPVRERAHLDQQGRRALPRRRRRLARATTRRAQRRPGTYLSWRRTSPRIDRICYPPTTSPTSARPRAAAPAIQDRGLVSPAADGRQPARLRHARPAARRPPTSGPPAAR